LERFKKLFQTRKEKFENHLSRNVYADFNKSFHKLLAQAVIYSLQAGGKRLRPVLAISSWLANSNSKITTDILDVAVSLESIHTYSLIHDDLPAMDNDDYRRGKLTCHKKFSESTAILAGDALNSYGFYKIGTVKNREAVPDLVAILHQGGGGPGMVSGQIEDLFHENHSTRTKKVLHSIHSAKTGALIRSAMLAGNRLRPDWKKREKYVSLYAEKCGLLFQITDDILDVEGNMKELGKTPGKDARSNKLTFPALYGMSKTKKLRDELTQELQDIAVKIESPQEYFFRDLALYIAERKN